MDHLQGKCGFFVFRVIAYMRLSHISHSDITANKVFTSKTVYN